jgi:hypothetical protein
VHARRHEAKAAPQTHVPDAPADDLLAGLRDSLQAMETVAAEMARASDTLSPAVEQDVGGHLAPPAAADDAEVPAEEPGGTSFQSVEESPAAAAAGGATVVPLRTGEP